MMYKIIFLFLIKKASEIFTINLISQKDFYLVHLKDKHLNEYKFAFKKIIKKQIKGYETSK